MVLYLQFYQVFFVVVWNSYLNPRKMNSTPHERNSIGGENPLKPAIAMTLMGENGELRLKRLMRHLFITRTMLSNAQEYILTRFHQTLLSFFSLCLCIPPHRMRITLTINVAIHSFYIRAPLFITLLWLTLIDTHTHTRSSMKHTATDLMSNNSLNSS